jgi:NAD(P) transhydrogenase subunit alpha
VDLALLRQGQTVIGFGEPLTSAEAYSAYAERGVTSFAMELIPRITRAQSMDALSSMATIAGY